MNSLKGKLTRRRSERTKRKKVRGEYLKTMELNKPVTNLLHPAKSQRRHVRYHTMAIHHLRITSNHLNDKLGAQKMEIEILRRVRVFDVIDESLF
jgi:hypothetical protein